MIWKYRPSLRLPYDRQMQIYNTCQLYRLLAPAQRAEVDAAVARAAPPEYRAALLEALTTKASLEAVGLRRFVSAPTLWRCVRRFYAVYDDMIA